MGDASWCQGWSLRIEACPLPRLLLGDGTINCALESLCGHCQLRHIAYLEGLTYLEHGCDSCASSSPAVTRCYFSSVCIVVLFGCARFGYRFGVSNGDAATIRTQQQSQVKAAVPQPFRAKQNGPGKDEMRGSCSREHQHPLLTCGELSFRFARCAASPGAALGSWAESQWNPSRAKITKREPLNPC